MQKAITMNTKKLSLVNASTLIASRLSVCLFFVSKHHLQAGIFKFFLFVLRFGYVEVFGDLPCPIMTMENWPVIQELSAANTTWCVDLKPCGNIYTV